MNIEYNTTIVVRQIRVVQPILGIYTLHVECAKLPVISDLHLYHMGKCLTIFGVTDTAQRPVNSHSSDVYLSCPNSLGVAR